MSDHDPAGMLGSFLGGGALAGVVAAVLNAFRKPSAPAEMIAAASNAAKGMMGDLITEIARVNTKVDRMELKHAECERRLSESEHERRELSQRIDELMAGRIAQPGERDLFR